LKYSGISHRRVEPRRTCLDLSDDHVWPIRRTAKKRIGDCTMLEWLSLSAANDIVSGPGKPESEDVEIGDSSCVAASMCLQHWVLRNGEVPVHVKVRLHESNGSVHSITVRSRGHRATTEEGLGRRAHQ